MRLRSGTSDAMRMNFQANLISGGASPLTDDVVRKPGLPHDDIGMRLSINIFANSPLPLVIWADKRRPFALNGGEDHDEYQEYKLRGKFSPSDKLETYSVHKYKEFPNLLLFMWPERTSQLILANDSLLLEIPYVSGDTRYRYSWDKEDLANQIRTLTRTCFITSQVRELRKYLNIED